MQPVSVFLACAPGLEPQLLAEARGIGVPGPKLVPGGVECGGGWEAVRRANLRSRIANRVLARILQFRAAGWPALDAGLREVDWSVLPPHSRVRVDASVARSRTAHAGAVAGRVAEALERAGHVADRDGAFRVFARVERDEATISMDTSGEPLHRRGFKQAVNRAPLRETLAAGFLRMAEWDGGVVLDPMCGSGTFPIEAAEMAAGLRPGRERSFAFEALPSHDPERWAALRAEAPEGRAVTMHGSDRDAGAVAMARANAERAGVSCAFREAAVSDAVPPEGPPGLVIVNPPYGGRLGKGLQPLHAAFGAVMRERFTGWRVAMVTSEAGLAKAAGLDWGPPGPVVDHGGIKVRLWTARVA
ncbi:class I SAM-dependent RNA methyltransferase [Jannaschia sp. W003]|uniref:THUMP domain-containing class I SAM-dependent RNA methyltransferase n=1 Tax=Jannaschia sp. W003 TaxID=2867012 RepID=UPI0021A86CD2|nr:class I SAM-dependent RNA methyltransferase [Jannaschia sp. W003]UWQ20450.1 class I SAM-dependent RNA methyltransferase [Jannaschia sp. W003]